MNLTDTRAPLFDRALSLVDAFDNGNLTEKETEYLLTKLFLEHGKTEAEALAYFDAQYGIEDTAEEYDQFNSDAEADADVLRSAGWGTDEDYGYYGDEGY